jgi:hypothetical protein
MRVVTFSHRQLVTFGLLATLGCGGGQRPAANVTPAPDRPEATVNEFLAAANGNDLDRMASLWGDENGPSNVSNRIPFEQRQQRLQIMQRVLRHDDRRVAISDSTIPGRPIVTAALTQGNRRFNVPFTCVQLRSGGWVIREVGLEQAIARPSSPTQP